jgi:hypothetical protein
MIAITIDDYTWKAVALAPGYAAKFRIDTSSRTVFGRLRDAPLKKIQIKTLFPSGETARHNL